MSNIDAMAADLFETISAYIDKRVAAVVQKMAEMQTKLDAYEKENGERHEAALDGIVAADKSLAQLRETVGELKALPIPKDGEAGTDGKDGAPGKDAPSVDIPALVKTVVAEIVVPKDGINGKDGEDGRDGRDAIQCDVLDIVDPERRYQRGTYAKHRGGRIRAFRATDPMGDGPLEKFGWTVDLEGVAEIAIKQGEDLRTFAIDVVLTSGKSYAEKFSMPVVLDRGKFERGKAYATGDAVSWDGSTWIAQADVERAADKPLQPDWRLSVKRGQDGKDAGVNVHSRPTTLSLR